MTKTIKANTAPATSNSVAFNMEAEHALIRAIRTDFVAVQDKANMAAIGYVRFALSTRNCDLIRMLHDALPVTMQGRLAQWIKVVAPIAKRTKKNTDGSKSVSFGIDKTRMAEEGLAFDVLNTDVLNVGPFAWVKPKAGKRERTLDELLTALTKSVDKTLSAGLENADVRAALLKAQSAINEAGAVATPHVFDASTLPGQRANATKSIGKVVNLDGSSDD